MFKCRAYRNSVEGSELAGISFIHEGKISLRAKEFATYFGTTVKEIIVKSANFCYYKCLIDIFLCFICSF